MSRLNLAFCVVILALAGAIGGASFKLAATAQERESAATPAYVRADPNKGKFYGAVACGRCHREPLPSDKPDYVLLTEYKTWLEKDKHSRAYAVLLEERSQQMGRALGIPDVTKDNRCLNCHAANVPPEVRERSFEIKDGVSCDACHGPAEKWFGVHIQENWRTRPMPEKEALGFIDVRDPVKRSKLCMSCHIGDAEDGKVVTHDMYAAGHPPLPSIELATFSHHMPRHWRYIREKDRQIQKDVYQTALKIDPQELEQTKLVAISSVVALRETANLIARQAEKLAADARWPDYALFDCAACHHDLKRPSPRQERGYLGTPGRPGAHGWPTAMAKVVIQHAGRQPEELDQQLRNLHAALDAQPFGSPRDMTTAGREVVRWSDELITQTNSTKYDQAAARRMLRLISSLEKTDIVDYDTARQCTWAFRAVYEELDPKPAGHADVQKILATLDDELKLSLPSGTGRKILEFLPESLQKAGDYDPDKLTRRLSELTKLIGE